MTWDFKSMTDEFPTIAVHVEETIAARSPDN